VAAVVDLGMIGGQVLGLALRWATASLTRTTSSQNQ
jgi:hypothetical protein